MLAVRSLKKELSIFPHYSLTDIRNKYILLAFLMNITTLTFVGKSTYNIVHKTSKNKINWKFLKCEEEELKYNISHHSVQFLHYRKPKIN
jgi:hypothetical protein